MNRSTIKIHHLYYIKGKYIKPIWYKYSRSGSVFYYVQYERSKSTDNLLNGFETGYEMHKDIFTMRESEFLESEDLSYKCINCIYNKETNHTQVYKRKTDIDIIFCHCRFWDGEINNCESRNINGELINIGGINVPDCKFINENEKYYYQQASVNEFVKAAKNLIKTVNVTGYDCVYDIESQKKKKKILAKNSVPDYDTVMELFDDSEELYIFESQSLPVFF